MNSPPAASLDVAWRPTIAIPGYFQWKFRWTRCAAALLLIPALPLIGLLIVLVRLGSRGAGLYRQQRLGLHGRPFSLIKIRSMCDDAEARTGAVWSQPGDPRVTRFGRFLRWSHLDELPQLFNVVRGEMCLIGPRPERPEIIVQLLPRFPDYLERLAVPPGITGWAQVKLPPDSDDDGVRKKLDLDLEYVRRGSLVLDLQILVMTAWQLVFRPSKPKQKPAPTANASKVANPQSTTVEPTSAALTASTSTVAGAAPVPSGEELEEAVSVVG